MIRSIQAAAVLSLVCGSSASVSAQATRFQLLPEGGSAFAIARGISSNGSVLAGDFHATQFSSAVAGRWVYPGPVPSLLGNFQGQPTSVDHLSRDGATVYGSNGFTAFRWTPPAAPVPDPDGRTVDVTPDGAVRIVSGRRQVGSATPQDLGAPAGFETASLVAISADGSAVIGTATRIQPGRGYGGGDIEVREAALWRSSTGWTTLGTLPGDFHSSGLRISDDATVIAGQSEPEFGPTRAWRLVAQNMTDLGTLPGFEGASVTVSDMSADGAVIVGSVDGSVPFLWTPTLGMVSLESHLRSTGQDLDEWSLLSVTAVSADGSQVIGAGVIEGNLRQFQAPLFATCTPPAAPRAEAAAVIAQVGLPAPGVPGAHSIELLGTPAPVAGLGGTHAFFSRLDTGTWATHAGAIVPPILSGSPAEGDLLFHVCACASAPGFFGSVNVRAAGAMFDTLIGKLVPVPGFPTPSISAKRAIYTASAGTLSKLVTEGDTLFGSPMSRILGAARFNDAGDAAFIAEFESLNSFSFTIGTPGQPPTFNRYPLSAGTVAAYPPGTSFTTPTLTAFTASKLIALTELIVLPTDPENPLSCIMVRSLGQTTNQVRVQQGTQAPGQAPGVLFAGVAGRRVALNDAGRIAFTAPLSSGREAALFETPSGFQTLATTGAPLPSDPSGPAVIALGDTLINNNDTALVRANLASATSAGQVLLIKRPGQPTQRILEAGAPATGLSTCQEFAEIRDGVVLNDADQVLIPVSLTSGAGVLRPALYLWDPVKGLVMIAAHNEPLPLLAGGSVETRNITPPLPRATATASGAEAALADDGTIVFRADVTSGPVSLFATRVAPPPHPGGCPGDLNNDSVVDTTDLVFFIGRFGQPATPGSSAAAADFNNDGVVSTPDLVFFIGRFGQPCP